MIVLHIAPINTTRVNGFRFSVPGLISAQNRLGCQAALLNIEKPELFNEYELEKNNFNIFKGKKLNLNELEKPFNNPNIVIFHGVYKVEYLNIYKKLIKANIPYIIVPRVSLTKGAQAQKFLKKSISNILFFNKFIRSASAIHYLTEKEKELSKKFKKNNFVVGNGIDLPVLESILGKTIDKESINITFIGRYDIHHKGLDILIQAINQIKNTLTKNNVKINLYGSDFNGGKIKLKKFIEDNHLHRIVTINEAVFGKDKVNVLYETDIFISTSRFEGHPMAVIEAMSYGIPCILTEGTNMLKDLLSYDAGWKAELDPADIAKSISIAISFPEQIYKKGLNARKLIEENYTWETVAKKTIKYYKNILNENV